MADFTVQIDVQALLANLDAGLRTAEQKVNATANKVDSTIDKTSASIGESSKDASGGLGKMLGGLGKLLAVVTAAEAAISILDGAFSGITGTLAAMSGDTEAADLAFRKMSDTVKGLPVIGGILTRLEGLIDNLFYGTEEAALRAEQAQKKLIESTEKLNKVLEFKAGTQKSVDALAERFEILRAEEGLERQLVQIEQDREKALAAIADRVEKLNEDTGIQAEKKAGLLAQLDQERFLVTGIAFELRKQAEQADQAKQQEEARKTIAEETLRIEKQRAEQIEKELQSIQKAAEFQSRREALEDRINKRTKESIELRELEQEFTKRIAEATAKQNEEEVKRLRTMREQLRALLKQAQAVEAREEAEKKAREEAEKKQREEEKRKREVESITAPIKQSEEQLKTRRRRLEAGPDDESQRRIDKEIELGELRKKYDEQIRRAREAGNEQLAKSLELKRASALQDLKEIQALEDQESARKKSEAEQKKAAAESAKRFAEREKAEKQLAELQESAQSELQAARSASATASFQTAAGSFTVGAATQVNEAKILNKIQKKSQELLQVIARNTGGTGFELA